MKQLALITGATGKLGSAIARHLAAQGWSLVLTGRDGERIQAAASSLQMSGGEAYGITLDLRQSESVESLADRLTARGIAITHLVNNARALDSLALDPDGLAEREVFLDELEIDVVGPYRLVMSLARHPRHNLRAIVNIGSQYGEIAPNPTLYEGDLSRSPVQYGVAKAALHHLTRELAVRLAPRIRVNCVAFGGFAGRTDAAFMTRYSNMTPIGRMLNENDAGGPVAFLLDDQASAAVNGHVLSADGGWSIW